MKWNLKDLRRSVEDLLDQSGFSPDLYIIKVGDDNVAVHFDKKEAVDYFRGDFDTSEMAADCIFEYKREGKRHAAYIYTW